MVVCRIPISIIALGAQDKRTEAENGRPEVSSDTDLRKRHIDGPEHPYLKVPTYTHPMNLHLQ